MSTDATGQSPGGPAPASPPSNRPAIRIPAGKYMPEIIIPEVTIPFTTKVVTGPTIVNLSNHSSPTGLCVYGGLVVLALFLLNIFLTPLAPAQSAFATKASNSSEKPVDIHAITRLSVTSSLTQSHITELQKFIMEVSNNNFAKSGYRGHRRILNEATTLEKQYTELLTPLDAIIREWAIEDANIRVHKRMYQEEVRSWWSTIRNVIVRSSSLVTWRKVHSRNHQMVCQLVHLTNMHLAFVDGSLISLLPRLANVSSATRSLSDTFESNVYNSRTAWYNLFSSSTASDTNDDVRTTTKEMRVKLKGMVNSAGDDARDLNIHTAITKRSRQIYGTGQLWNCFGYPRMNFDVEESRGVKMGASETMDYVVDYILDWRFMLQN